ncbi:hypothetical protein OHA04_37745 [Streptomyces sp. NBC_01590]|uniref:hypothetical protein n=1 Tax=Streptomyces sp. NBC_01590 TaxID=2975887 RepID=UPI00386D1CE8
MSHDDHPDNVFPLFKKDPQAEGRRLMIETWEALYLRHDQTLTDSKAAASLHVAMEMVTLLLNGACDEEVIDEGQRDQLLGIVHTGHAAADQWQN